MYDGVLHCEHEDLHGEADAEADDDHVRGLLDAAGLDVEGREEPDSDCHHQRSDDREDLVATEFRDQSAGSDRSGHQAEDEWCQQEARLGR